MAEADILIWSCFIATAVREGVKFYIYIYIYSRWLAYNSQRCWNPNGSKVWGSGVPPSSA